MSIRTLPTQYSKKYSPPPIQVNNGQQGKGSRTIHNLNLLLEMRKYLIRTYSSTLKSERKLHKMEVLIFDI